jgi:hypothetical protein
VPKIDDAELRRFRRAGLEWDSMSSGYVKWVSPYDTPHGVRYKVHVNIHPDSHHEYVKVMRKVPGGKGKLEEVEELRSTKYWNELHVRYDRVGVRGGRPIYFWYSWDGVFRPTPHQSREGFSPEEKELKRDADAVVNKVFGDLED